MNLFQQFEVHKGFFFSYTYDLTHSLQENIMKKIKNRTESWTVDKTQLSNLRCPEAISRPWETSFMWNKFLVEELYEIVECKLWVIPFINGSVIQSNFSNFNRRNNLVVISRRSRFYAGTRYLKRGISELGDCANFVETEQILQV